VLLLSPRAWSKPNVPPPPPFRTWHRRRADARAAASPRSIRVQHAETCRTQGRRIIVVASKGHWIKGMSRRTAATPSPRSHMWQLDPDRRAQSSRHRRNSRPRLTLRLRSTQRSSMFGFAYSSRVPTDFVRSLQRRPAAPQALGLSGSHLHPTTIAAAVPIDGPATKIFAVRSVEPPTIRR